jgi:hypothetical protein
LHFGFVMSGYAGRHLFDEGGRSGVLFMNVWGLLAVFSLLVSGGVQAHEAKLSFLDNGVIRVGVDLEQGGAITWVSASGSERNVINAHDRGRQIQLSFYSGPQPFGAAHPDWKNWPWNPIGTGDVYGHASTVVKHTNDGKTLYTRSIPLQWALNNVPGECTFETWITLDGATARVRNRLTNRRPDTTQYRAFDQELPALYTIGKLHRLFTYDGDRPYTQAPLRQVENDGPPWTSWKATEHWAALLDNDGWGLGIYHPNLFSFIGGFHGKPDTGGPTDDPTGYIAPVRQEILDHNIVYDYDYVLILGKLETIRAYATIHRPRDTRPDYVFAHDRQHWTYVNAHDAGWPLQGALRVHLDQNDPQMIGPEQWWSADSVPHLTLRAAFHTHQKRAELFWSLLGKPGFAAARSLNFDVIPDGQYHTYTLDLAAVPTYTGTITGLRFDPVPTGEKGDYADITSLSWRSEPGKK